MGLFTTVLFVVQRVFSMKNFQHYFLIPIPWDIPKQGYRNIPCFISRRQNVVEWSRDGGVPLIPPVLSVCVLSLFETTTSVMKYGFGVSTKVIVSQWETFRWHMFRDILLDITPSCFLKGELIPKRNLESYKR